jgi:hypothetical protein
MLRKLLAIASRVGVPGTLLELGDSDGRLLYLSASMDPVSVIVGLERDDVRRLHASLGAWLAEREDAPPRRSPAPLVAGRIGAGLRDAADRTWTVQLCTVPDPAHAPGQDGCVPERLAPGRPAAWPAM